MQTTIWDVLEVAWRLADAEQADRASLKELAQRLHAWRKAGAPMPVSGDDTPPGTDAARQRYLEALEAYAEASGAMPLGAFEGDDHATAGAHLRQRVLEHLEAVKAHWSR